MTTYVTLPPPDMCLPGAVAVIEAGDAPVGVFLNRTEQHEVPIGVTARFRVEYKASAFRFFMPPEREWVLV